jgi:hypothetical protein
MLLCTIFNGLVLMVGEVHSTSYIVHYIYSSISFNTFVNQII